MRQHERQNRSRRNVSESRRRKHAGSLNFADAGPVSLSEPQENDRHRMPGMGPELGRRRVVAGDDQHIGIEGSHSGQPAVDRLDGAHLAVEIAVFSERVRVLDVHEEEVERVPGLLELGDQVVGLLGDREHLHPHGAGHAAIHRIDGQARRPQLVARLQRRQRPILAVAAHEHEVGRLLIADALTDLVHESGQEPAGVLCRWMQRHRRQRRHANRLGIGFADPRVEPLPAKHEDGAVPPLGGELETDVVGVNAVELRNELLVQLG